MNQKTKRTLKLLCERNAQTVLANWDRRLRHWENRTAIESSDNNLTTNNEITKELEDVLKNLTIISNIESFAKRKENI